MGMMRGMSTNTTHPDISNRQERHQYELDIDGKLAAWIHYRMHGEDTIELVHTEVKPEHEGKGLASKIATFAFDDARARGLKVIPTCTYLQNFLKRHGEYQDLLAQS
jgi:predicted GNAT family acetyltransferase